MELSLLHFSHPGWLWGMLAIPLIWMLYFFFYQTNCEHKHLEKFIDAHLLPYLLVKDNSKKQSIWKSLILWSAVWSLLMFAIAGPRWNLREIDVSSKDQSLVILLDLSESMNANDVKPTRLVRAKQKIEDLINSSQGVKFGLVAFAADPHMIAPITEDKETLRYLLPSLDTDLVYIQGSRLSGALNMATAMLDVEPGTNKAILVISDGDFEDSSAIAEVKRLAERGIVTHVLGVGTAEGAILQDKKGNTLKKDGSPVLSKLSKNSLEEIAHVGKGNYFEGKFGDEDILLRQLAQKADSVAATYKKQIWDEYFYLLVIPALPVLLWWFRKGTLFAFILSFFIPTFSLQAGINEDYFMNAEGRGKLALENEEYAAAVESFQDPYRKGIAYYRMGNYAEAEKMFRNSNRKEVAIQASYNLGNALALQNKFKEAIAEYEKVLKEQPDHLKAKENLELLKKMMQERQNNQSEESDQQDKQNSDQDNNDKKQNQNNNSNKDKESKDDSESLNDSNKDHEEENDDKNSDDQEEQGENDPKDDVGQDQNNQSEAEQKDSENQSSDEKEKEILGQNEKVKSQEDQDADLWLNRINNDPKNFLKNKFYLESKNNKTKEAVNPW